LRPPDDLDIRLMQELASPTSRRWEIREPLASIAKRLGVDEDTARRRLKWIEQTGLIRGYHLIPNPHLFDLEAAEVDQTVEAAKASAIPSSQT
jgi:DNA-binding Lrp family transcriptional regulator